jgi:hypothetical protein
MAEYWPAGPADWSETYEPRLLLFLKALEAKEDEMVIESRLTTKRLSSHMKDFCDRRDFWVSYAARKSWTFDRIFGRGLIRSSLATMRILTSWLVVLVERR